MARSSDRVFLQRLMSEKEDDWMSLKEAFKARFVTELEREPFHGFYPCLPGPLNLRNDRSVAKGCIPVANH